jgi:signal transduction histidine kinase
MLREFLIAHTPEIIARARAKVSTRTTPLPTEAELKNGVPLFLSQLIELLHRATSDSSAIKDSAALHGGELLTMGFTVSQVVHGYGDICQVVTQLADETDALITANEFHTFNRCLDDAIAHAVSEYQRQRDASVAYQGTERQGMLAHEMRNRLNTAMLAFTLLQDGTVGTGGSTAGVLGRTLRALGDLITNSIAGVRLDSGLPRIHRRLSVSRLVEETRSEAIMEATAGGFELAVSPGPPSVDVDADPQLLAAALSNLLQNAFKFSRPHGHVALRTTATADRVTIEVEDECGGLPGSAEDLFVPFSQRNANRTGLGLGLSISRLAVESMDGTLSVRDLPGKGCIFSIELPRLTAS